MKYFASILISVATLNLLAADFTPFDGPKPIAVFIQTDPWAMVMGADTPRAVVYEDGTVIFLKKSGKSASYHRKDLSATELADFKKRLTPRRNRCDYEQQILWLHKQSPTNGLNPSRTSYQKLFQVVNSAMG